MKYDPQEFINALTKKWAEDLSPNVLFAEAKNILPRIILLHYLYQKI